MYVLCYPVLRLTLRFMGCLHVLGAGSLLIVKQGFSNCVSLELRHTVTQCGTVDCVPELMYFFYQQHQSSSQEFEQCALRRTLPHS
jgi:hypothetical protein